MILPGAVIGGAPLVTAVTFTDSTDMLRRASGLTGGAASNLGTFSFWFKPTGLDNVNQMIFSLGTLLYVFRVQADDANAARRRGLAISSTPVFYYSTTDLTLNVWTHCLISWRTNGSNVCQVYFNDVADTPQTSTLATGTINWGTSPLGLARSISDGPFLAGDVAEFWFANTYIDLSVTDNRRKFIKADGKPAFLGLTGQRPTGSSPLIYLKGPASNWGTNSGTGGDFTVTGTFTDATPP
jgi:hypothetical protein